MATMNQDTTLLWSEGYDDPVEVNQRALIDKILARYPGEFTVFRELLQNSDDAGAPSAEIHFRTQGYVENKTSRIRPLQPLPDLKTTIIHEYVVRNSGQAFRDEDWKRLKKIADGNPDVEKIGAFGVGFYSTFSICEKPMVTSGPEWMRFYFKDGTDQLFVRRGTIPTPIDLTPSSTQWTEFNLLLREPSPIPNVCDLTRFLVTGLTFMRKLNEVSIWLDDVRLSVVNKTTGNEEDLRLPMELGATSSSCSMTVTKVTSRALQIKAQVLQWIYAEAGEQAKPDKVQIGQNPTSFFGSVFIRNALLEPTQTLTQKNEELLQSINSSIVLAVYSAHASVSLDAKLAQELHRSTKKNAPVQVRVDLIYTGKHEYDRSIAEEEVLSTSIFRGLRADLDSSGTTKIFIGHITSQTTGIGGHLSAYFIPTVERESIDLQDRNVSIWNRELLYVGGYLARAAYELEMEDIQKLWDGISDHDEEAELRSLQERATHALRFFTFHPSQPSAAISELLESGFFDCGEQRRFPILSTRGIQDASCVRMPNPNFSFLETLAVAHPDIISDASGMVNSLRSRGFLTEVTFQDVLDELRTGPLSEPQMAKCLDWYLRVNADGMGEEEATLRRKFFDACSFVPDGTPNTVRALSTFQTFVSSQGTTRIIVEGPLPNNTLPFSISRLLPAERLTELFGWTELGVVEWLSHVVAPEKPHTTEFDIRLSDEWAALVLNALARGLVGLSQADKDDVLLLLSRIACVPTKTGMFIPGQAYFANVDLFPDLPIVALPKKQVVRGDLEKLLELMGVRRHIDLQLLFQRMLSGGERNAYQLIKYLCSVQSTLSESERKTLETTEAFSREGVKEMRNVAARQQPAMFALKDLYEPLDTFRAMNLPLLQWDKTHPWRSKSEEARFLAQVGLRKFPPLETLLQIASSTDVKSATTALGYLLANVGPGQPYESFHPTQFPDLKFIPVVKPDGSKSMESPLNVYTHASCAIMGFAVPDLALSKAKKLHIDEYPSSEALVKALLSKPTMDQSIARRWFEFLASRSGDFKFSDFNILKCAKFIPALSKSSATGNGAMVLMAPEEVYFGGGGNTAKRAYFSQLFVFIDFGDQARTFLRSCGVDEEPNPDRIARMLVADPKHFLAVSGGYDALLDELRFIASNERNITPATMQQLKASPALVATKLQHKQAISEDPLDHGQDDLYEAAYDLVIASNAVINDNQLAASIFAREIFCAPQEDILESFYTSLGSSRLSTLVNEEYRTSKEVKNAAAVAQAQDMRDLILERLPLFFHDMRSTSRSVLLSWDWLRKPENLHTSAVDGITRVITLTHGSIHKIEQVVSASTKHKAPTKPSAKHGQLVLSLVHNTQVDMYEVAGGLCRLILKQPRVQDSLLLLTLLTTSLESLEQRGYHVDRILQRRAVEGRAIVAAAAPKRSGEGDISTQSRPFNFLTPLYTLFGYNPLVTTDPPVTTNPPVAPLAREPTSAAAMTGESVAPRAARSQAPHIVKGVVSKPQAHVTPRSAIDQNVEQAIAECRPTNSQSLHDPPAMTTINEAQGEGYCDVSGRRDRLELVDTVNAVDVYIALTIQDRREVFEQRLNVIKRFISIVSPLKDIYNLRHGSLHIFLDVEGAAIAFNQSGSLFLNLRYYEAWHDEDVMAGKPADGFKSWYFTLAHEIAHNLAHQHDAQHSFYFSAISQKHISGLYDLIQQYSG